MTYSSDPPNQSFWQGFGASFLAQVALVENQSRLDHIYIKIEGLGPAREIGDSDRTIHKDAHSIRSSQFLIRKVPLCGNWIKQTMRARAA